MQGKIEYRRIGSRTGLCFLNCHGVDHSPKQYPGDNVATPPGPPVSPLALAWDEDAAVCPLGLVVALPLVAAAGDAEEPPGRESAKTAATMIAITTMKTRRATSRRRR